MSTPGSVRSPRIFRWQGIIPLMLLAVLVLGGWTLFGDRIVRGTMTEAATKAMGAEFDIADLNIRTLATTIEMQGISLADPFDRNRNLIEVGRLVMELEPAPLLERKVVVKRLAIAEVRTGTHRATPARVVSGGGFAPSALAEVRRFAAQFKVPLLALVPIDSLKALVLNPGDLKAVQGALAVGRSADSARQAMEAGYAALRLQETLDSSAALVTRLQGTNVRTLGIEGARNAVADVRRATARVDSARARVDALVARVRRSADSLQAGVRAIDDARREDYDHARSLLRLPSFDAPDIGAALFGKITIDKFQQAVYWAELARRYAPPGLLPRESPGPKRVRRSGSTVHFVKPQSYPRFLLRRADVGITMRAAAGGAYALAVSDLTTDPAIVGRPTLFAVRRGAQASADSLRVVGSMDHTRAAPREVISGHASGIELPALAVPSLPYSMDPGKGTTELRFVLDGQQLSGTWAVHSRNLTWNVDSARARKLNSVETLVSRVLTGIHELDVTADVSGTLAAPRLAVKSNLDRQVADRLRAVAGEEIAAAQARVRAQVDRLVEEKSAPVKAKVSEVRAEGERRLSEARARLDDEKRKLEERLKALSAGLVGFPRLPGVQ